MNRLPRRAALSLPALALAPAARAQSFPDRPVRWIVGFAPGGGTDTLARLVAQSMSQRLGQPVVVENRPGAATNVAAEATATAAPDGHTVMTADNGTLINNTALFARLPYDPERDFRPLGLMARFALLLVVGPQSRITTARQFVEAARGGGMDYASPGVGSPHHLTMERLAREAGGLRLTHVPYRGAAPAVNDIIAGTVESMILDLPSGLSFMRAGRVRPLAICSPQRHPALPDVPTVTEALGLAGFESYAWQGLVAPARTPDAVAQRLTAELAAAIAQPAVRSRMEEIGLEPLPGGPDDMRALTARERALWVPLIRDLRITLD